MTVNNTSKFFRNRKLGNSTEGNKQDVVSATYEQIGLFPRSFSRVTDRFLQQLFSDVDNLIIHEYRFYRYLFFTTFKSLLILFCVPFLVNLLTKNYIIRPVTEYIWNSRQTEIFLNTYQQKRAFLELKNFEEKLYFESLVSPPPLPVSYYRKNSKLVKNGKTNSIRKIWAPPQGSASYGLRSLKNSKAINNIKSMNYIYAGALPKLITPAKLGLIAKEDILSKAKVIDYKAINNIKTKEGILSLIKEEGILSKTNVMIYSGQLQSWKGANPVTPQAPKKVTLEPASLSLGKAQAYKLSFAGFSSFGTSETPQSTHNSVYQVWGKHIKLLPPATPTFTEPMAGLMPGVIKRTPTQNTDQPLAYDTAISSGCLDTGCFGGTPPATQGTQTNRTQTNHSPAIASVSSGGSGTPHYTPTQIPEAGIPKKIQILDVDTLRFINPAPPLFKEVDKKKPILTLQEKTTGFSTLFNLYRPTLNNKKKPIIVLWAKPILTLQEKTKQLAARYNLLSIEAITNFCSDLISFLTLCYLLFALEIQVNITKSFLLEVFFGLDDSKKSLLILLITDLLVGYHSSNIWELFFEFIFDHYGFAESQTGVFLLVATLPVLLDVLFKYLIFRHLNRSSPATVATYHAMID
jgi:hypothetical protein